MSQEEQPHFLDSLVKRVAGIATSLGYNGGRLEWKWRRRKSEMAEGKLRREMLRRSAKGTHKMCPECRALVGRTERKCPECGQSLAGVSTPGLGRAVSNILPGLSSAVSLILLVNGLWFVLMMIATLKAGSGGGFGFDGELLVRFGSGLSRPWQLSTGEITGGEWWRKITPIFLHGGLIHFMFNSYMLVQLGKLTEQIFGTTRFWVFYLTCGIGGSLASQLLRPVNTVGASGAIMGIIGLLLVYGYRNGGGLGPAVKSMAIRLGMYTLVLGFFVGIDHYNHIGGFLTGAAIGALVPTGIARGNKQEALWQALAVAGIILVLAAFYQVAAFGRAAT